MTYKWETSTEASHSAISTVETLAALCFRLLFQGCVKGGQPQNTVVLSPLEQRHNSEHLFRVQHWLGPMRGMKKIRHNPYFHYT